MQAIVDFLGNTEPWHWIIVSLGALVLFAVVLDITRPNESTLKPQKISLANFLLQYDPKTEEDIEGAYALHNVKQDKWLVSSSTQVYRELNARINGKIKPSQVHKDIRDNQPFDIYILELKDEKSSRAELCEKMEAAFSTENKKTYL